MKFWISYAIKNLKIVELYMKLSLGLRFEPLVMKVQTSRKLMYSTNVDALF